MIAVLSKFGLMSCIGSALGALVGELPPPPPTNPLALAEPADLDALLVGAGLTAVSDESKAYPFPLGPDEATARQLCVMLMRDKLDALVADGQTDAVERYVEAFMGVATGNGWAKDGQIVIPPSDNVARIVVATKD